MGFCAAKHSSIVLSNSDKTAENDSGGIISGHAWSSVAHACNKKYVEFVANVTPSGEGLGLGFAEGDANYGTEWLGINTFTFGYYNNGNVRSGGLITTLATFAVDDVISMAIDIDTGKIWIAKNASWLGSGSPDPAAGTDPIMTNSAFVNQMIAGSIGPYEDGAQGTIRLIESEFTGTIPEGFEAWSIEASEGGGGLIIHPGMSGGMRG